MSSELPTRNERVSGGHFDDLIYVVSSIGVVGFIVLLGRFLWIEQSNPDWRSLAMEQWPIFVGLPVAAAGAFIIVALFRTTEGKIVFNLLGFKFEGASGPIVMWILCFLAIVLGINTLSPD